MSKLYVVAHDIHYPKTDAKTLNAMFDFIKKNKIAGAILAGDQMDNESISHHTKGKPLYRERAAHKREEEGFEATVLTPLEKLLPKGALKVWIIGNHDRFEHDLIECQPELEGIIDRVTSLNLADRGWEVVPLGHAFVLGKLNIIHGEILTGIGNQAGNFPAKKAVELYAGNVLAGHTHAPQSYTRVSPINSHDKWMGWIAPILGKLNPSYLRNRPTAWVSGFTIVELRQNGAFNLYPVVVTDGTFSFGGKEYGGKKK